MTRPADPFRIFVALAWLALLVTQVLQAIGITRYTPVLRQFWDWYDLSVSEQLLYPYHGSGLHWLLPAVTLLVGFDVLRRKTLSPAYATTGFVVLAGLTLAVQLVLIGPLFRPLASMIINR